MNKTILKRIADAANFYELHGYTYIDLPWTVNEETSNLTKPIERQNFYLYDKVLVASGEQSFLEMVLNNNLLPGKYYGITPCFRDEETLDDLHHTYFMKLELFQNDDTSMDALSVLIHDAEKFFNNFMETTKIITNDGFDIVTANNIELGSYGIRELNGNSYIYDTGLAEPRFSKAYQAINL